MKQIILAFTYVHEGSFYFWQATYSAPVIFVYIWFVMNVLFLTSFYATFQCGRYNIFFCPPKHKKLMRREVNKLDIKIRRLIFGTDFKDCHVCKKKSQLCSAISYSFPGPSDTTYLHRFTKFLKLALLFFILLVSCHVSQIFEFWRQYFHPCGQPVHSSQKN